MKNLAEHIIPSFYIVDIRGAATQFLFPEGLGIDRVVVQSSQFENDMEAIYAMDQVSTYIASDHDHLSDMMEYNPDFYPTMPKIQLTGSHLETKSKIDARLEEIVDQLEAGQEVFMVKHDFDEDGDFVVARRTIQSTSIKIVGKAAVDPNTYVEIKKSEAMVQNLTSRPAGFGMTKTVVH